MSISLAQYFLEAPCSIHTLPDELLEFIICLVSPYLDLQNCALVCKRWHDIVIRVRQILRTNLLRSVLNFNVQWEEMPPTPSLVCTITKRHSHSACYYDNSMYIFGGCTSSCSTFNDLWRLDLTRRNWVRPLTTGTYPSPKACASFVCYKGNLYLFGGWSHPSPYPLHQAWRLFNELHVYSVALNRWTYIMTPPPRPPPMAGHSATVHGSTMVIFGGLHKKTSLEQFDKSNDVWCYDLGELGDWRFQPTLEPRPKPRYGQSQIWLTENHLLIIGGCGGPTVVFSDVWILEIVKDGHWKWHKMKVQGQENAPHHLWCHPSCRVGHVVVTFARSPDSAAPQMPYKTWSLGSQIWIADQNRETHDRQAAARKREAEEPEPNVNGRRGVLGRHHNAPPSGNAPEPSAAGPSRDLATLGRQARNSAQPSVRPNASRNRERQLETLKKMEDRIKKIAPRPPPPPGSPPQAPNLPRAAMTMFVLDISRVLIDGSVTWVPLKTPAPAGPEETILYSLVLGMGELIMFGGVEKDSWALLNNPDDLFSNNTASNNLRFISAPRGVV